MTNNKKKREQIKESGLTYDDYAALDDENRYELVEGQLELMSPSPSTIHQMVNFEIQKNLTNSCEQSYFILYAPIDIILSSTEVRQPDIVLVHRNRIDILTNRGIEGTPDLVIEILSPSSLKRYKIDKLNTYAQYEIPDYWIVDPNSFILEQYILSKSRYDMNNIFQDEEIVTSPNLDCVSFTMKNIRENTPVLKSDT